MYPACISSVKLNFTVDDALHTSNTVAEKPKQPFNLSQSRFLEIFPPILKNVMNEILLPHMEYFCQKFRKTREFMWFHVSIWKHLF